MSRRLWVALHGVRMEYPELSVLVPTPSCLSWFRRCTPPRLPLTAREPLPAAPARVPLPVGAGLHAAARVQRANRIVCRENLRSLTQKGCALTTICLWPSPDTRSTPKTLSEASSGSTRAATTARSQRRRLCPRRSPSPTHPHAMMALMPMLTPVLGFASMPMCPTADPITMDALIPIRSQMSLVDDSDMCSPGGGRGPCSWALAEPSAPSAHRSVTSGASRGLSRVIIAAPSSVVAGQASSFAAV